MGLGPPVCLDCKAIMVCYTIPKEGSHWWCGYCKKPLKQLIEEGREEYLFCLPKPWDFKLSRDLLNDS